MEAKTLSSLYGVSFGKVYPSSERKPRVRCLFWTALFLVSCSRLFSWEIKPHLNQSSISTEKR